MEGCGVLYSICPTPFVVSIDVLKGVRRMTMISTRWKLL